MLNVHNLYRSSVFACGTFVAALSFAQTELPTTEVTGTRLNAEPFEQPYAFYRYEVDDASTVGRTALDRANYGAGMFLQRTAPNQASPFVRGLTGEQALLMLDGVRLNHAFMRPGPNQYAALVPGVSVQFIDSILGSSSAVNGSDGLTGGLDFRLAPAGRGLESGTSTWAGGRVDTGNGVTLELGVDGVEGNVAYSIDLSGSSFHDRVGGKDFKDHVFGENIDDEIPNTAYDEYAGTARFAYLGFPDRVLELNAGHTRQLDAPRPDGYFENTGKSSRLYRYFDPMEFSFVHLRDKWDVGGDVVNHLQTTVYWHQFAEEQFRSSVRDGGTPEERIRVREYDNTIDVFGLDLQATTIWGNAGNHELVWGGTYVYETTDNAYREFRTPEGSLDAAALAPHNQASWANNTTVSDGSKYTTFGLFAQDNWQLSDRLSLLTGLRYSRVDWSFGDVDGDADDVTGSLRALYELSDTQNVFVGASKGFRAPNLTNLDGLSDRGSSGEAAAGNPDLEPEVSYTAEAGWKFQNGRDVMQISVFHTTIDDLIQRDFSGDGEFTNVEEAELYGFESSWDLGLAALSGENRRVSFQGSISLVDATRDIPLEGGGTVEDNISRANRVYGNAGLKVEEGANWWGLAQVRWHDDYDDVATHPSDSDADDIRLTIAGDPDGSMPGYAVVDLLVGWKNDAGDRELTFFVENVADDTYRAPGSGTDGVGRSFGVSGRVRW